MDEHKGRYDDEGPLMRFVFSVSRQGGGIRLGESALVHPACD